MFRRRVFRHRACASFQKSHWNGMETRWKVGRGRVFWHLQIEKKSNTSIKQYLVLDYFSGNSPWLWLVILALNFWWWTWLHVSVAYRLVSSQVSHGLLSFLSTGPCWSIESQQDGYKHWFDKQWNWRRRRRSRGLVLGTGVCGSRPRNGAMEWNQVVYQWCSRLVRLQWCWLFLTWFVWLCLFSFRF